MEFDDEDRREVEEQNDDAEEQQQQMNIQAQPCSGGRKGGVGTVRYRECQKNHAVSIGGHAVDGCGEFMPAGEEGTLDALKCAACGCHRNFHRKEGAGAPVLRPAPPPAMYQFPPALYRPPPPPAYLHHPQPLRQVMPAALGPPSPEQPARENSGGSGQKRFRTKFSEEQKERMRELAERLGWRIQRHDEAEVQRFCREVGVNRQVLKVWMHNNKNHFPAIANP